MLYHLFDYLNQILDISGIGVFKYLSFRLALAMILSILISFVFGKNIIKKLKNLQMKETVRDLGLEGQMKKTGTPTMGGLIIILSIFLPTILFADLTNIYIQLVLVSTIWLGLIGFLDDYIKVFKKRKSGLSGKFKIIGQVGLGLLVGIVLYYHPDVVVREVVSPQKFEIMQKDWQNRTHIIKYLKNEDGNYVIYKKTAETTIPFVKENEFDYAKILKFLGKNYQNWAFIIFIPFVIFIITAVSNGANLSDGLDGLAAGSSAIMVFTLMLFAYLSGNVIFSNYLNIMYIPKVSELVIFMAAMLGASIGFLWYNTFPAQVFMGDTGSLSLGGLIAILAIIIRKELLIPLLAGIFLIENLSVILQVSYFKYTKKRFGEGKRIFLMSPLHHHYQKKGFAETKIVTRFWIVGILLALLTIITLKIR